VRFDQAFGLTGVEQLLRSVDVGLEARAVGRREIGLVDEARRRAGNRADHTRVVPEGQEIDRFDRTQAVAPQRHAPKTARGGEVEPGREILATIVDHLIGGAEAALLQVIRLVVAAIIDAQDGGAVGHKRIADAVKEGRRVEVAADTVVADHHVNAQRD
jgi:hypothetical protein